MKKNKMLLKITSSILFVLSFIFSAYFLFSAYRYNSYINSFFTSFNDKEYNSANKYLTCNENFNIYKLIFLKKDLDNFSAQTVEIIDKKLKNNTITDIEAARTLYELEKYSDLESIKTLKNDLPIIVTSRQNYNKAAEIIKDNTPKSYENALEYLDKVSPYSDEYADSLSLKGNAISNLKSFVLEKSNTYAENNNYSKALEILDEYADYLSNDSDIINKKNTYSSYKNSNNATVASSNNNSSGNENKKNTSDSDEAKTTQANNFLTSITSSNINQMGIGSPTKYLIYVNLSSQKVFVYSGKTNKWSLEKTMPCSSGIEGYETPKGVFDITDRGDWFFSDKYNDGAKYWVQFKGNYLFHSLPFKDDKSTITDYTLGKAASHGCIRLSVEDAKWIYDNISDKTKVIIN